jgi:hypothetical protein
MKVRKVVPIITFLILAVLTVWSLNVSAEEKLQADANANLKEMPVLTGEVWLKMTHDEKVAFVWGMGHMLSIERNIIARHPEVKKAGFSGKMAEGLAGISMNDIIRDIDKYYQENPDDLSAPVIEVIWDDIAKPRIKPDTPDK